MRSKILRTGRRLLGGRISKGARSLPLLPAPAATDRVLVFAPHPDDEALAAGGYLARAIEAGAVCSVILVTDGNRRGLKKERAAEFAAVLGALGISKDSVTSLGYANGNMGPKGRLRLPADLRDAAERFSPTIVIAPHPSDMHGEHRLVAAAARAIHAESSGCTLLEYLIHYPPFYPWPRAYAPDSPLMPPPFALRKKDSWVSFPLSHNEVERKKHLVELYASQLKTPFLRSLMYSMVRSNELFNRIPARDAS